MVKGERGANVRYRIVSVVLFVLHSIQVFRSKFWQRGGSLKFPTGTFEVAFTIRILRQEEQSAVAPAAQPALIQT
jgi:hypothetical protein